MLLSNCVVCGKKNQILLKIKNFTVLIIFQISLKWRQIVNWRQIYATIAFKTDRIYIQCK